MTTRRIVLLLLLVPVLGALAVAGLRFWDRAGTVYGEAQSLGNGTVRAFVTRDADGTPRSVGLWLSAGALEGLPAQPPPVGPAHETTLRLPSGTRGLPYDHVALDWNPAGHEPEGVYTQPHFDVHFYMITEAERDAIDPSASDFEVKAARQPDAAFLPANHVLAPGAVPRMGNHWIDRAAPEMNGQPFSTTFLYGTWDGRLIFLEPMTTVAYLEGVRAMEGRATRRPIPQPAAVQTPGYYPTTYSIQYDEGDGSYAFVLEGLTYRP